jgi:hypothetical protein
LGIKAYLIGEPDMGWAFRFRDLLSRTILLIFEQEDHSVYWFRQDGQSIIVNAKDLMDSKIANTNVFQNGGEKGLMSSVLR